MPYLISHINLGKYRVGKNINLSLNYKYINLYSRKLKKNHSIILNAVHIL
jgi:hypothetical protein